MSERGFAELSNEIAGRVRQYHERWHEQLPDFAEMCDALGLVSDEEVAMAITADALMARRFPTSVVPTRYAPCAATGRHSPAVRKALEEALCYSLHDLDDIPLDEASELAAEQVAALLCSCAHSPLQRSKRAAMTCGLWTPIQLVGMFLIGVGMTVATLYWMGFIDTANAKAAEASHRLRLLQQEYAAAIADHNQFRAEVNEREAARIARNDRIARLTEAAIGNRELLDAAGLLLYIGSEIQSQDPSAEHLTDRFVELMKEAIDTAEASGAARPDQRDKE